VDHGKREEQGDEWSQTASFDELLAISDTVFAINGQASSQTSLQSDHFPNLSTKGTDASNSLETDRVPYSSHGSSGMLASIKHSKNPQWVDTVAFSWVSQYEQMLSIIELRSPGASNGVQILVALHAPPLYRFLRADALHASAIRPLEHRRAPHHAAHRTHSAGRTEPSIAGKPGLPAVVRPRTRVLEAATAAAHRPCLVHTALVHATRASCSPIKGNGVVSKGRKSHGS